MVEKEYNYGRPPLICEGFFIFWIFIFMSNTAEVLSKLMGGLYKDVVDGLLIDYVVKEYPNGPLVVHVLLNNDAYWKEGPSSHGGWFNLNNMKERIGNLMRYVNLEPIDVNVVPYFDNSKEDMDKWNKLVNDIKI